MPKIIVKDSTITVECANSKELKYWIDFIVGEHNRLWVDSPRRSAKITER